jgi:metallo-beta-lactamase class B
MENTAKTVRLALAAALGACALAAIPASAAGPTPAQIAAWNQPQAPFKIYGNTYYVGTKGITSVLITSDFGHVLIDGGTPQAAQQIAHNIEALGFKPTDVKAILNSHAHWDHLGGVAELQALTGAPVYLRRPSEEVLRTGKLTRSDPQYGLKAPAIAPAKLIWIVSDEQWLGVGSNRLQDFATPGHTPGGTTWVWDACEKDKCLKMVYADSLSPVSADHFKFSASKDYPQVLDDFALSFKRLESLPCDVLITPHPDQSQLFERIAKRPADDPGAIKEDGGCKRYAQGARAKLAERLATEKGS